MLPTIRTVMARAIDYAGLFPPARLPMEAAVAEYRGVLGGTEAWMLARFVCPIPRLAELAALWPAQDGPPLPVAALSGGAATATELEARAAEDTAALRAFAASAGRRVVVDQVELRLPADLLAGCDADAVRAAVAGLHSELHRGAATAMLLAVEAPVAGAPPETVRAAATGIARWNRTAVAAGLLPVCLKLRCGGLDATAIPTVTELAAALAACRAADVPVKATQGLHHPFRRFDHLVGEATHGFLNLLAAAILARAHRLDEAAIAAVLAEQDPARFRFTAEALEWDRRRASLADLAAGRRHALIAFGSCSFAEPRDDLAAFGLLEE